MKIKIAECNKCKEAVIWAKSKKSGANMMFNEESGGTSADHKWQLFDDEGVLKAEFVGGGGDDLRSSHFDTCPAKDGGTERRAAAEPARRPAVSSARPAQAIKFESATIEPGSALVTIRFGNLVYSGECRLVSETSTKGGRPEPPRGQAAKRSDADDSEDL